MPDNFAMFIGTAGWNVPREIPGVGTHLERYAKIFNAAEINSSFHRAHYQSTYKRWAAATPPSFRFAVKMPKLISHVNSLANCEGPLADFASQVLGLGKKLGVLLLQLPPKHTFDPARTEAFIENYRATFSTNLVLEPRHSTWFEPPADQWLSERNISRAAADPGLAPAACVPGGWRGLSYFRWHGSPRRYYSSYTDLQLAELCEKVKRADDPAWCIFDNTASGAAFGNALALARLL